MTETIFAFGGFTSMNESMMDFVLGGLDAFARQDSGIGEHRSSLQSSVERWRSQLDEAPTGTSDLYLDEWISDDARRETFLRGLEWVEQHWVPTRVEAGWLDATLRSLAALKAMVRSVDLQARPQ